VHRLCPAISRAARHRVVLDSAGYDQAISGVQRGVDLVDGTGAYGCGDFIESVENRQDQLPVKQRLCPAEIANG
jgi:hypothetical protein